MQGDQRLAGFLFRLDDDFNALFRLQAPVRYEARNDVVSGRPNFMKRIQILQI